jgi:hypothetical protein
MSGRVNLVATAAMVAVKEAAIVKAVRAIMAAIQLLVLALMASA